MVTQGPTRRWALRAATAGVVAGLGLVLTPTAAAADGPLTPLADCVKRNGDGSYTVVMGYENTGARAVTLKPGSPANRLRPGFAEDVLPSRFEPGVHRGAATGTVDKGKTFEWQLDGKTLRITSATLPPSCPPPTEMPAEGNGTGIVIGLAVAGLAGAVLVRSARRRTPAVSGGIHDA